MRQRIITGVIGAVAVVLILLSNSPVFKVAIGLISLYALHEIYSATGIKNNFLIYITGLLFSVAYLISNYFGFSNIRLLLFTYLIVLFIVTLARFESVKLSDMAFSVFFIFYIIFTLSHISQVRDMELGKYYVWFIIIGAFATDTFAYFTGISIGKHKLCPKISPKKTIEGAIGGVVGVVLCFVVMGFIFQNILSLNVNFLYAVILALICGFFSEIGDLAASMIKRKYDIKDFGTLLPGHGGNMDRLDGIILVSPLIYYFIQYFPVLG